jgi:hypothetical protein
MFRDRQRASFHCRWLTEDWRLEYPPSAIESRPSAILLDREDLPASEAREEGLDTAAGDQAFDLAIGECRIREGNLTFDLGAQDHEALEPPARSRSVGQTWFAEQAKQYPSRPNI